VIALAAGLAVPEVLKLIVDVEGMVPTEPADDTFQSELPLVVRTTKRARLDVMHFGVS
jgi:hypothetical protein